MGSEVGIFVECRAVFDVWVHGAFNGLAKSSKVVLKHAWIAEARMCVMAH